MDIWFLLFNLMIRKLKNFSVIRDADRRWTNECLEFKHLFFFFVRYVSRFVFILFKNFIWKFLNFSHFFLVLSLYCNLFYYMPFARCYNHCNALLFMLNRVFDAFRFYQKLNEIIKFNSISMLHFVMSKYFDTLF